MGFGIGKNDIFIHKIFYIIHQTYKEELCAGFWVKGFKVKVDQDKSSLYLKRAKSLVLTNSWPQEAREVMVGLGGHAGPWAAQVWALRAAFPLLQPCWTGGQLAMFSRESEVSILRYNLLILMLATPPRPRCAGISLQSLQVFVSSLDLGVFFFFPFYL